jgi:hypothetical protein
MIVGVGAPDHSCPLAKVALLKGGKRGCSDAVAELEGRAVGTSADGVFPFASLESIFSGVLDGLLEFSVQVEVSVDELESPGDDAADTGGVGPAGPNRVCGG